VFVHFVADDDDVGAVDHPDQFGHVRRREHRRGRNCGAELNMISRVVG
jgi:hypothetical protein